MVRYKILKILKSNKNNFVSGEIISSELGVTRTTVWKRINDLRDEGYVIWSSPKKGYLLSYIPDVLNAHEIGLNLNTTYLGKEIYYFKTIDSTNHYSKKIAADGCKEGTLVVAGNQTSGRGRLGRIWESQDQKGIWMSIILKPEILPSHIQIITLAASIAVVSGIKEATGISAGIKWPNDIILDGKKVCGILTEMSSEPDRVNYIILGIGINVNQNMDDFNLELRDKAISLKMHKCAKSISDEDIRRSDIIKAILLKLEELYENIKGGKTDVVLNEWKDASITLGKEIKVVSKDSEYIGIAIDITDEGKLVVQSSNGIIHEFISGEVTIRGINGYAV